MKDFPPQPIPSPNEPPDAPSPKATFGVWDLGVRSPLTREEIYEERMERIVNAGRRSKHKL